jgi:hypothetical protein
MSGSTVSSSGCDHVQGYVLPRPLPIAELASMLHDRPEYSLPPNNGMQPTRKTPRAADAERYASKKGGRIQLMRRLLRGVSGLAASRTPLHRLRLTARFLLAIDSDVWRRGVAARSRAHLFDSPSERRRVPPRGRHQKSRSRSFRVVQMREAG